MSVIANQASIPEKVRVFCALGEDRAYLEALRTVNPRNYRRMLLRVWVARFLRLVVFRSEPR